MRAVIWAGVSSRPQAEKESLAEQIQAGRELAAREGWEVVAVLVVPGMSRSLIDLAEAIQAVDVELASEAGVFYRAQLADLGATTANAYAGLQALIAKRGLDVLVCRSRDRIGRTVALVAGIEERLQRIGAFIHSRAMPATGSPIGDIMTGAIEGGLARTEIMQLTDKHRAGHDSRARAGLPFTHIPFGYRAEWVPEGGRVVRRAVVVPAEADAYRWAVAAFQQRKAKLREIAARFAVLFPERPWSTGPISNILRNPFYAGLILRRRKRQPGETELLRVLAETPDPLWPAAVALLERRAARQHHLHVDAATAKPKLHLVAPGVHEPLLGLAEWLDLQLLLEQNSASRRPWSGLSIWAGIVRCGKCGSSMSLVKQYYICSRRRRFAGCDNPMIGMASVTAGVAGYLRTLLEWEAAALEPATPPAPRVARLAGWERQLAEIEGQRERANLLFVSGRIKTTAEYDRHVARIDAAEGELRAAWAEERLQVERLIARRDQAELLTSLLDNLEERIAQGEPAEVNRWLRQLFVKVLVVDRRVTAVYLP